MSCKCAITTDEYHGWECTITGGACEFLIPDSKVCAEKFGGGSEAQQNYCENCESFYLENNIRCCKNEPLRFDETNGKILNSKYIAEDVECCGGWKKSK